MQNQRIGIIGGGLVGLATAWQIQQKNHRAKVTVFEKEQRVASHQSGRNSGVIHSGIYYKPKSLKAQNCLEGYHLLLKFCEEYKVNFEICGKLVVANDLQQEASLEQLMGHAKAHQLTGVIYLSKDQIGEKEPYIRAKKALWVPQTGTIDFPQLAQKLFEQIVKNGGSVHLGEPVTGLEEIRNEMRIKTSMDNYPVDTLINCGGLYSDQISSWTEPHLTTRIIPFRGEYYKLKADRAKLINRMVYPAPANKLPFWGLHFHRNIHNDVEIGPSAVWAFKREGYRFGDIDIKSLVGDLCWPGFRKVVMRHWGVGIQEIMKSLSKSTFLKVAQKVVPSLQADDLIKSRSGVRAQACERNGSLIDDFRILKKGPVIHVCNAPSPAATSCLSIGKSIANLI